MMNNTKSGPPERLVNHIDEASKHACRIYYLYIGLLVYCALTVVNITDRQITLKDEKAHLPILNINVSVEGFFIIAPIIAMLVFTYMQLHLYRLKGLIEKIG
jgi:hypothetical protein